MIPHSRPLTSPFGQVHSGTCHEVGHTWHPSCLYCTVEVFSYVYWGALKIYGPLYIVRRRGRGSQIDIVIIIIIVRISDIGPDSEEVSERDPEQDCTTHSALLSLPGH